MKNASISILPAAEATVSFKGYRFPPDIICYAVWLYYRFPLSLRRVEELLAARGIELTYETVRCWATTFGLTIAKRIRATAPGRGDKWHLDEVVVTINGRKHWLWRAVDQHGAVLDVLVQRRRDTAAAKRLMRKLLRRHGCPRVMVTDKLHSGEQRTGAERRASAAQGIEQPGGKLASADSGAGEGDAAIQIGAPTSTILLGPWTGFESVHGVPIQSERAVQTRGTCPGLRDLGKGCMRPDPA